VYPPVYPAFFAWPTGFTLALVPEYPPLPLLYLRPEADQNDKLNDLSADRRRSERLCSRCYDAEILDCRLHLCIEVGSGGSGIDLHDQRETS
jgi:hypothetical protein